MESDDGEPLSVLQAACIGASVSYRHELTTSELSNALLTGRVQPHCEPHFRVILDEMPQSLVDQVIDVVGGTASAAKARRNLSLIAAQIGAARKP